MQGTQQSQSRRSWRKSSRSFSEANCVEVAFAKTTSEPVTRKRTLTDLPWYAIDSAPRTRRLLAIQAVLGLMGFPGLHMWL